MARAVWLEVALNGAWGKRGQPLAPVSTDELVEQALACIDAGASIVHFHAYDPDTGRQRDAYELYAPVFERLRARTDAIVYPTIPFAGNADQPDDMGPARRFAAVESLAQAGLLEWTVVDPGSTTLASAAEIERGGGFVYLNPQDHIAYGMALCARHRLVPSYAIYEPGFARYGAALQKREPEAPGAVYRLMFSDALQFGFPPRDWALAAYRALLDEVAPGAPWMAAGLGVDVLPLAPAVIAAGGHLRTGLEDVELGSETGNVALVQAAVRAIESAGGRPATPSEIRATWSGRAKEH